MALKHPSARFSIVLALALASGLCIAAVRFRVHHTGEGYFQFLVWNLILAWAPLVFALGADFFLRRGHRWPVRVLGLAWLVFFPNAPYILSDFVHLQKSSRVPLWYDGLLLSSFAWTGLLLGFASLYLMQNIWRRAAGAALSWVGVVASLTLASVGVYLGRVFRFNSWDVLTKPGAIVEVLAKQAAHPFRSPWLVLSLAALTAALIVGYAVVYGVSSLRLETERRARAG